MFKIGIIGSENSHAPAFMDIFRSDPAYADLKVVGVGGVDAESNKRCFEEFQLEFIAERPEDMLGKVDAVMVTARDGKYHAEFSRPFLEAGLPMFIDKPFTTDPSEAVSLAKLAKSKQVPLTGGSSLKNCYDVLMLQHEVQKAPDKVHGGSVVAPLNMENPYSGFWFYSSHLAEICMTVFGYEPVEICAMECAGNVTAMVRYQNFVVENRFMDGCYEYFGQVSTKERLYSREIDGALIYRHECDEFAEMLRTRKMRHSYEQLVAPVFYLDAVKRAYETRKTVKVEKFGI